jgi:hypothetical protein
MAALWPHRSGRLRSSARLRGDLGIDIYSENSPYCNASVWPIAEFCDRRRGCLMDVTQPVSGED